VDDAFYVLLPGGGQRLRCWIGLEQIGGDPVDQDVGRLRRKHDRNDQLKRILMVELTMGVGMEARKPSERVLRCKERLRRPGHGFANSALRAEAAGSSRRD